jgi:hypothetical protein
VIDILEPLTLEQVPDALFALSDAYLDSAEKLNTEMKDGVWPSSYQRGQVVLYLTLHSVELNLKGCIKKLDPSFNSGHSTIAELSERLRQLKQTIEFDPPFGTEPLPIELEGEVDPRKWDRIAHQVFRYPMDRDGKPWQGLFAYSADMFSSSITQLRHDFDFMRYQVSKHDG